MKFAVYIGTCLTLMLCAAFITEKKTEYPSLLWEIQNENGDLEGYLLGTMHSGDSGVYAQLEKVAPYLEQCAVYSGELDFNDLNQAAAMSEINFFMTDTTLAMLYDSVEYRRVSSFLSDQLGPQGALMEGMKPFWISATLTMQSESMDLGEVLDVALQEQAEEKGLEIKPLETVLSQMSAIDAIPLSVQAQMLWELADGYDEQLQLMNELPELYASQDLQMLYDKYQEDAFPGDMHGALVTRRNVSMMDSLVVLLEKQERVFCAVGALHLPGDDGMIGLLRSKGYNLEPVILD